MKKILIAFLFILTAIPAAFSADDYVVLCISENTSESICNPTDKKYKVIKGTIVEANTGYKDKISPVTITFIPDDSTEPQVSRTAGPSFAFQIEDGVPGKIKFSADDYQETEVDVSNFKDSGEYIELTPKENTGSNKPKIYLSQGIINESVIIATKSATSTASEKTAETEKPATPTPTATSTRTRAATSNQEPVVQNSETITISGKVYYGDDTSAPLSGVRLSPKGIQATSSNSANSSDNGSFVIRKFPKNASLVAAFYTNNDAEFSYAQILRNQSNLSIFIQEQQDDIFEDKPLEDATVTGGCLTQNQRERLHATEGKWLGSGENKDGVCIPTACEENYTLENPESKNAECVECEKTRVPFARTTKVENNKCVPDKCESHFTLNGDKCVVNCDEYKDKLNATAVAHKAAGPINKQNDYSSFCYPTQCNEPLYKLEGIGENARCEYQVGKECFLQGTQDMTNKRSIKGTTDKNGICKPDCYENYEAILENGKYECKLNKNDCPDRIATTMDTNANTFQASHWNNTGDIDGCKIIDCKNGYVPDSIGTKCVDSKCGCGQVWNQQRATCETKSEQDKQCNKGLPKHATGVGKLMCQNDNKVFVETCDKNENCREICVVQTCDTDYVLNEKLNKCDIPKEPCSLDANNTENVSGNTGTWEEKSGVLVCRPTCIGSNYEPDWDSKTKIYNGCVIKRDREGKKCPNDLLKKDYPHASKGEIKTQKPNGDAETCKITDCDKGYNLNKDKNECVYCPCGKKWDVESNKCKDWAPNEPCTTTPTGATSATCACKNNAGNKVENPDEMCATEGSCTEYCEITECNTDAGYELDEKTNKCISNVGKPCTEEQLRSVNHAKAGKQQVQDGTIICAATECENGYELNPQDSNCVPKMVLPLDKYQDKIADLKNNADAMHEKENSWQNRLIGAAGIGATGVGGSMVGAALSERAADAAAESAMREYVGTFSCDYGNDQLIDGGTVNVELPGGNDLMELYADYTTRATDLKVRKDALGMRAGIESEIVIPSAETGLYEYTPDGVASGSYASIARAILYGDGPDADMWAAQKQATADKLKTGAIVAGVGAVGSLAANIAVNHDNPNKVKDTVAKYEKYRRPFNEIGIRLDEKAPSPKCESYGATGTYPNCNCGTPSNKKYFLSGHGCYTCDDDLVVNEKRDNCVCPGTQKPKASSPTQCEDIVIDKCDLKGDFVRLEDGSCKCMDNATQTGKQCKCSGTIQDNQCILPSEKAEAEEKVVEAATEQNDLIIGNLSFNTTGYFNTNEHLLKDGGEQRIMAEIQKFATENVKTDEDKHQLKTANNYCLLVVGQTDRVTVRADPKNGNQKLSENRAKTVANILSSSESPFNPNNIESVGIADEACPASDFIDRDDKRCRRVDVIWVAKPCNELYYVGNLFKEAAEKAPLMEALSKQLINK